MNTLQVIQIGSTSFMYGYTILISLGFVINMFYNKLIMHDFDEYLLVLADSTYGLISQVSSNISDWVGDRFREHLRDVEINDKDASKPVTRHSNLLNHSQKHMAVCGLSLHLGNTESRKNIEQKFIFQIGTLSPYGINERFSFL